MIRAGPNYDGSYHSTLSLNNHPKVKADSNPLSLGLFLFACFLGIDALRWTVSVTIEPSPEMRERLLVEMGPNRDLLNGLC